MEKDPPHEGEKEVPHGSPEWSFTNCNDKTADTWDCTYFMKAERKWTSSTASVNCQNLEDPTKKRLDRRDINLQNLDDNTVRFTLWNEMVRKFDMEAYANIEKPAVMPVSSC